MTKEQRKEKFKESKRKFIVSLKRRPHNIPLALMLLTYVFYSLNLTKISNTTAVINIMPMGLCEFVEMLFSILAIVSFLNAFPKRRPTNIPMLVIMYALLTICAVCDVVYLSKLAIGISHITGTVRKFIPQARVVVFIHLFLLIGSIVLVSLIKVLQRKLNKIDTSIDIGGDSGVSSIDIQDAQ